MTIITNQYEYCVSSNRYMSPPPAGDAAIHSGPTHKSLSNDGWVLKSGNGLQVAHFQRDGHQLLKRNGGKLLDEGRVSFVLLHIDSNGGPAAGSARQAEHDSRPVGEEHSDTLVLGD